MAKTTLSTQQALNLMNSSSGSSLQKIANQSQGNALTGKNLQTILNTALGNAPTLWSEQRCLYAIIGPKLSLTGHWTSYTEQHLMNLAYESGTVSVMQALGLAA